MYLGRFVRAALDTHKIRAGYTQDTFRISGYVSWACCPAVQGMYQLLHGSMQFSSSRTCSSCCRPTLAAFVQEQIPHLGRPRKVQCKEISLGLVEVLPSRQDVLTSEDTCIPHVSLDAFEMHVSHHVSRMSRMYLNHTSEDTCILHVSCMYLACIMHLRYVPLWIHLRYMYLIMYLGCIPRVSPMYPQCSRTTADTFIPYVFLMNPACILHVS